MRRPNQKVLAYETIQTISVEDLTNVDFTESELKDIVSGKEFRLPRRGIMPNRTKQPKVQTEIKESWDDIRSRHMKKGAL